MSSKNAKDSDGASTRSNQIQATRAETTNDFIDLSKKRPLSEMDPSKGGDMEQSSNNNNNKDNASHNNDDHEHELEGKEGQVDPPIVANGMVEFQLNPVNVHLTCKLCSGYFRDPYTIAECLHTFCKSCLFYAFSSGFRNCPECNTDLGPDPFKAALADRQLQELVDKVLFPSLQETDDFNGRAFYAKRGINLKPQFAEEERIKLEKKRIATEQQPQEHHTHHSKEGTSSIAVGAEDDLNFILIPDNNAETGYQMPSLDRSRIRVSGRFRIVQLKKYLLKKLQLSVRDPSVIEILCNGGPVGNELSLTFVARTIWLLPDQDLQLFYRLAEDSVY